MNRRQSARRESQRVPVFAAVQRHAAAVLFGKWIKGLGRIVAVDAFDGCRCPQEIVLAEYRPGPEALLADLPTVDFVPPIPGALVDLFGAVLESLDQRRLFLVGPPSVEKGLPGTIPMLANFCRSGFSTAAEPVAGANWSRKDR